MPVTDNKTYLSPLYIVYTINSTTNRRFPMTDCTYADLSLNNAGMVYLRTQALRLCTFAGQSLLAVGNPDNAEFYDAHAIITGLHTNANLFDLPLPEPVPVLILDEFDAHAQQFLREFAMGADIAYLKTLVPAGQPDLIIGRAASLGFVVQKASTVKALEAEIREKAAAEMRARVLESKSADLTRDYVALPDGQADRRETAPFGVVRPCPPAVYERILRNTGGYSQSANRIKWPFKTMRVGDEVTIDPKLARRAQTAVHVYATRVGWCFRTTTDRISKALHVVRVEDRPE
jgi:hypothetical protein